VQTVTRSSPPSRPSTCSVRVAKEKQITHTNTRQEDADNESSCFGNDGVDAYSSMRLFVLHLQTVSERASISALDVLGENCWVDPWHGIPLHHLCVRVCSLLTLNPSNIPTGFQRVGFFA